MNSVSNIQDEIPYNRKALKHYSKDDFTTISLTSELYDSLKKYRERNSMQNSEVLSQAITELRTVGPIESQQFEDTLIFNPAPESPRKRTDFKIKEEHFEFILKIIKGKKPIVNSTSDFIRRVLTWYLREKGFLEKPEKPSWIRS
jgi:predicted CopG family antitoxin